MFDYLIKNATLVDGLGGAPKAGDLAIKDGVIAEIGTISGQAKETINAEGAYAAPGWVDVHTHYDGQVSWDDVMDPSFSHGVTSVVMGNCGVGFAPCPPGGEQRMIELMEGVEDIPGTALYEGIEWGRWETFPEYIEYLGTREYTLDIGTQVPHSAVRNYVMGERALRHEDATAEDLSAMAAIVQGALEAGALGFSTSRTIGHRSVLGEPIPGTFAEKEELLTIGHAIKAAGRGLFKRYPQAWSGILQVQNIGQPSKRLSYLQTLRAPVASNARSPLRKMAVGPINGAAALILLSRHRTKVLTSFHKSQRDPLDLLRAFSLITCLCVARPT